MPPPGGCSPDTSLQQKACLFSLLLKVVLKGEDWAWMDLDFTWTYHILCKCVKRVGVWPQTVTEAKVGVSGESMRNGLAGTWQADPGVPTWSKQTNKHDMASLGPHGIPYPQFPEMNGKAA